MPEPQTAFITPAPQVSCAIVSFVSLLTKTIAINSAKQRCERQSHQHSRECIQRRHEHC